jgi:hypothetical protein
MLNFLKSKLCSKILLVINILGMSGNFINWVNYGGYTNLGFAIFGLLISIMLVLSVVFGPDE